MGDRLLTLVPVYTASRVSNVLPTVRNMAMPLAGARQVYHTELLPYLPAWRGSPASRVANKLVPTAKPFVPTKLRRSTKLSSGGARDAPDFSTTNRTGSLVAAPTMLATTTL